MTERERSENSKQAPDWYRELVRPDSDFMVAFGEHDDISDPEVRLGREKASMTEAWVSGIVGFAMISTVNKQAEEGDQFAKKMIGTSPENYSLQTLEKMERKTRFIGLFRQMVDNSFCLTASLPDLMEHGLDERKYFNNVMYPDFTVEEGGIGKTSLMVDLAQRLGIRVNGMPVFFQSEEEREILRESEPNVRRAIEIISEGDLELAEDLALFHLSVIDKMRSRKPMQRGQSEGFVPWLGDRLNVFELPLQVNGVSFDNQVEASSGRLSKPSWLHETLLSASHELAFSVPEGGEFEVYPFERGVGMNCNKSSNGFLNVDRLNACSEILFRSLKSSGVNIEWQLYRGDFNVEMNNLAV